MRRRGRTGSRRAGDVADPRALSNRLDLRKVDFDTGRAAEEGHGQPDLLLVGVDLLDLAREVGERTTADAHLLAHVVRDIGHNLLRHRLLGWDRLLTANAVHLGRGDLAGVLTAEEAGDLGCGLDKVPARLGQLHLDEDIAGEELVGLLNRALATALSDLLGRYEDLSELLVEAALFDALLEVLLHRVLVAGEGVDDVPLHERISCTP